MTTDNAENLTPAAPDTISDEVVQETPVEVQAEVAEPVVIAAEADVAPVAEATEPAATDAVETVAEVETTPVAAPASLTDLKPKQELRGKVKNIELFGAFIDLGIGVDGLVHISQISTEAVKNVKDVLKEGDEVTVWVRKIDVAQGRLDLTMIKPLGLAWNEIRDGMSVAGKVVKIERFGVFVDIGAERPGMIHVSELAGDYVEKPEDLVKIGDDITAKVIRVNRKKKQIDLSRKALLEPEVIVADDPEDDTPIMTAMELALRNAMRGTEMGESFAASAQKKRDKKQSVADKRRLEQEELLNRTLKQRVK